MLGDLFLHGIGGAKYDQVTNQIVRRFFEFTPPEFATVSATLRLPITRPPIERDNDLAWQQRLRELRYHPERFIANSGMHENPTAGDGLSAAKEIIVAKRRWINTPKTAENACERHLAISTANELLQPYVERERRAMEEQGKAILRRQRARAILDSREYSFCLFPRSHFDRLLLDGLSASS
jgi:hypothetical protein